MKKKIASLILSLATIQHLQCADFIWIGGVDSNILNPQNWTSTNVPGGSDTAVFSSVGTYFIPTLNGSPPSDISIGTIRFADKTSYNHNISVSVSTQLILQQTGIENLGGAEQFFLINGPNSILRFENSSSADVNQSDNVYYSITNSGRVRFANTATASNSHISLLSTGGLLEFFSNATAAEAKITINGSNSTVNFFNNSLGGDATLASSNLGSIVFTNTSKAQNAVISLDKSTLTFNSSSQANSAHITAVNTSTVTFSTNSSANAAFIKANRSKIFFNNNASGDSATISLASFSNLEFNQNNTLASVNSDISSKINIKGFQLTLGNTNENSVIEGVINGLEGSLIKNGTGTLVLDGENTYTGETVINNGKLAGYGSVAGNLTLLSSTTFSSGNNTVDSFRIGGQYVQHAGTHLQVFVNGQGYASTVAAAGKASINGDLRISSPNNTYSVGNRYVLVHSDQGLTGTFVNTCIDNPYFIPTVTYDSSNAFLTVRTDFKTFTKNQNQSQVAKQIDQLAHPNPSQAVLINDLAQFEQPEMRKALDFLSGSQYVNLLQINQASNRRLIRRIGILNLLDPYCNCYDTIALWIEGGAGRSFISDDRHSMGLKGWDENVNGGLYKCARNIAFGAAVDYEWHHLTFNQHSGDGEFQQAKGTFFGSYQFPFGYLAVDVIGGGSWGRVNRAIPKPRAFKTQSDPETTNVTTYCELGQTLCYNYAILQPYVGLNYTAVRLASTKESCGGIADLKIKSKILNSLDSLLGFHFFASMIFDIDVKGDIAWRYRCVDQNTLAVKFRNFGHTFKVKGVCLERNSIEGLLQAECRLYDCFQFYALLQGERGKHYANIQTNLGFEFIF